MEINKATIIGTGLVGSTTAYTLMGSGLLSEILLIDANTSKAEGEAMDLNHGMPFVRPVRIKTGDYCDCHDSDIIIICAGANQKPGETRIDLVRKNTLIFKSIINNITKYNNKCILLVVTNPVDILTYITYKLSGFPKNRVIGSGTVLDTSRFKFLLGNHTEIDPRNVHAYIIGEHGDTEVAAWSMTNIAGIPYEEYCKLCKKCNSSENMFEIFNSVRNAAYQIIERKGATYYAVALAVNRIVEAMVRDEHSILTVSSVIKDIYGIEKEVALSLPTVVDRNGTGEIHCIPLSKEEKELLVHSADTLRKIIEMLENEHLF